MCAACGEIPLDHRAKARESGIRSRARVVGGLGIERQPQPLDALLAENACLHRIARFAKLAERNHQSDIP